MAQMERFDSPAVMDVALSVVAASGDNLIPRKRLHVCRPTTVQFARARGPHHSVWAHL